MAAPAATHLVAACAATVLAYLLEQVLDFPLADVAREVPGVDSGLGHGWLWLLEEFPRRGTRDVGQVLFPALVHVRAPARGARGGGAASTLFPRRSRSSYAARLHAANLRAQKGLAERGGAGGRGPCCPPPPRLTQPPPAHSHTL